MENTLLFGNICGRPAFRIQMGEGGYRTLKKRPKGREITQENAALSL